MPQIRAGNVPIRKREIYEAKKQVGMGLRAEREHRRDRRDRRCPSQTGTGEHVLWASVESKGRE